MSKLSIGARQELVQAVMVRYQSATAEAKSQILDEFIAVTGYHVGQRGRRKGVPVLALTDYPGQAWTLCRQLPEEPFSFSIRKF